MTSEKTINDLWDRMEEILEENDNKTTPEYELLWDIYMRMIEHSNKKMRAKLAKENEGR